MCNLEGAVMEELQLLIILYWKVDLVPSTAALESPININNSLSMVVLGSVDSMCQVATP